MQQAGLLHIDAEAARASEFGQILVNGTWTFSLMVGLSVAETTLSTLVANHPAVRTNPGAAGSQNRGSLNVEDISFHGASPYQNLFQIDGIDATNRVDPASKNLNLQVGNVPSNPQSYFIDTSLRVYAAVVGTRPEDAA